jgi:hypothetical protein
MAFLSAPELFNILVKTIHGVPIYRVFADQQASTQSKAKQSGAESDGSFLSISPNGRTPFTLQNLQLDSELGSWPFVALIPPEAPAQDHGGYGTGISDLYSSPPSMNAYPSSA